MQYDIIIIGAGPGGYVMAERAGQRGKSVLLIEKEHLGGVCLNKGCIPTKTLLNSAKHYVHAKEAADYGVSTGEIFFELSRAMEWKKEVIETLRGGVSYKMKKNKVKVVKGEATFLGDGRVQVSEAIFTGENVVIATGARPLMPPIPGAEQSHVMSSNEILNIDKMPTSLVIIGGGVIGVEFASFFSSLGVSVTVIEMLDEIIPFMDKSQAAQFRKALKGKVEFKLGCKVDAIDGHQVRFTTHNGDKEIINTEVILMAVGRVPNIEAMGLKEAGLDINQQGIITDEQQRTNLPNVYAIGDVTGKSQLAHSASRMGEVALSTICGEPDRFRINAIPWVVYSLPEIAGCGFTEEEAIKAGYQVESVTLPMTMSGRFLADHGKRGPGSVNVIKDKASDVLLGVHMFGGNCSEIIWGVAAMIEAELRIKDIREIVFPHPTVGEVIRDATFEM